MGVGFDIFREVVIDDVRGVCEVEAAACQVGSNHGGYIHSAKAVE